MAEPLSPIEIAGITILVTNAARQLDTLMTAMVTPARMTSRSSSMPCSAVR